MLLPPSSFKVRLVGFLGLLLSTLFGAWVWNSWNEAGDYVEEQERAHVRTLVQTLAPLLDGGLHERAASEYPEPEMVHRWESCPEWLQYLRRTLVEGVRYNGLETPIATLRIKDSARATVLAARDSEHPGAMEVVLTSSSTPTWRQTTTYRPEMGVALFDGQATTTRIYHDSRGSWISAFAPIRNIEGDVVGLLRADATVSDLLVLAREHLAKRTTFGLAVLVYAILGCVILTLSVTRSLSLLQSAASRLGAGDYATPFHIPGGSREIQDVTEAFELARVRIASHIEAQERLNSALEMTRHDAESANRAKSLFLANMSHDLRTPLNAIIGFVQLLRQADLEPAQREMVDTIQRASESLHAIVGDILDFSKISEGKLELAQTRFDVRTLIQETGELLSDEATRRGLALSWSCAPEVPRAVHGDPARLRQILGHLVGNALKFTDIGSVRFTVDALHVDGNHTLLRFEVADTGIGIEPEHRERLFEPFSPSDEYEGLSRGTGIGLSLCRSLCRLMGGEIGAESEVGRGSTFWFTVELSSVASQAGASPESPPSTPEPLPEPAAVLPARRRRSASGRRILIAEDSAVNRRMTLHMVRRLGYMGEVAVDGMEAVDAVRCETFDAVLMDCQMPRMDGFEAARAIRAMGGATGQVPIIAFTASGDARDRERVLAAGMVDMVTKPITLEGLNAVLERWCAPEGSLLASGQPLGSGAPA